MDELAAGLFNDSVVLQPTTVCNLDCKYCYLPDRRAQLFMAVEVIQAIAADLHRRRSPVRLLWHGGEPLATGLERLTSLLQPFEELRLAGIVSHTLQTNGTLINDAWASLLKQYGFAVGVSVDGPSACNDSRRTWAGRKALSAVLRGLDTLRDAGIPFHIIAVVSAANIRYAHQIYNFAADLGCQSLGINIEEVEGLNRSGSVEGEIVSQFWAELLDAWLARPSIEVREFRQAFGWARGVLENHPAALGPRRRELYPTVSCRGDVVMLSPEFIGVPLHERERFIVGNVLETPLSVLCERAATEVEYVQEFLKGVQRCEAQCSYFSYCRGGTASNKYFETGSVDATTTNFCKNTKQRLMETVLGRAKQEATNVRVDHH
jgi:uncharacterized protein